MIVIRKKTYSFPSGYGKSFVDNEIVLRNKKTGETLNLKTGRDSLVGRFMDYIFPSLRRISEATQELEIYKSKKKIGTIILRSGVDDIPEDTLHIIWISIYGKEEGKGHAQSVIKEILKKSKKAGFKYVTLDSADQDVHRHLYPKLGFKYVEGIPDDEQLWGCKAMKIKL